MSAAKKTKVQSETKAKLSSKEEAFVESYLSNGGNGADAAKQAGYKQTPEALRVTASRMLTNANIQERIRARLDESKVTSDEVISTLGSQMRADMTNFLPDDGGIISQIRQKGLGHLVKKIKVRREIEPGTLKPFEVVELELHNQQTAAIQLKIMGLETLPKSNPFDDQAKASAFITAYMEETGHDEEKAKEQWAAVAPLMSRLLM
jgi:hypothetical protein